MRGEGTLRIGRKTNYEEGRVEERVEVRVERTEGMKVKERRNEGNEKKV